LLLLLLPSSGKQQHFSKQASKQAELFMRPQVREAGLQPLVEWQGHELEAWMAHWDRHQVRAAATFVLCCFVTDCTHVIGIGCS
jgi:hypothetical protein